MHLPLLKDGIVVNVVELSEGTRLVSKSEHREISKADEASYEASANGWRTKKAERAEEIKQAETSLFMAKGMATSVKAEAKSGGGDAQKALNRVLLADAEVDAWTAKIADMKARPGPDRPKLVRTKCWIVPEGHVVGDPGGNIGDVWDGSQYIAPEGKRAREKASA